MRHRSAAGTALAAAGLLAAAAPRPAAALAALTALTALTEASSSDPLAPVVAAASLAAWLLAGWLLAVCLLTLTEQQPGLLGRAAGAVASRLAPLAVRRSVALLLGVTLSVGALGGTAASASPRAPVARAAGSLDWPSGPPPALDWAAPAAPTHAPDDVVVAPGDSLWAIAADHLPAGADAKRVARAWPSWWAANRDAIGPDPDLIQPGTHLHTPS